MSGEEGVQMSMQMMTSAGQAGIKIITKLAGTSANLTWQGLRATQNLAAEAVRNKLNSGDMNLKRLQTLTGGDLHQQEIISPDKLAELKTDLKKRGLNFSIENAADGNTYLHFSGKDIDTISHALNQVMKEHSPPQLENTLKDATHNTAPAQQVTLDSLNPTGSVFVSHDPQARAAAPLGNNMSTLAVTQDLPPDQMVTIYRGVPEGTTNTIVAGDYITTNKQLAQDYAGTGTILENSVPAGDILDDLTEPGGEEYIYRPGATEHIQTQKLTKTDSQPTQDAKQQLGQKDIKAALKNKVQARADAANIPAPARTIRPGRKL